MDMLFSKKHQNKIVFKKKKIIILGFCLKCVSLHKDTVNNIIRDKTSMVTNPIQSVTYPILYISPILLSGITHRTKTYTVRLKTL